MGVESSYRQTRRPTERRMGKGDLGSNLTKGRIKEREERQQSCVRRYKL